MQLAIISDIHGNAIALDSCLEAIRSLAIDSVVFLGDAVGYMPAAEEVVARLRNEGILSQKGNHEAMMLAPTAKSRELEDIYGLHAARLSLSGPQIEEIRAWPASRELSVDGRSLLFVHGTPNSPLDGYLYPDGDAKEFGTVSHDVVFMGNTHRPFVATHAGTLFVNVGSVGLPRDRGDWSAFAWYDTEADACQIYRVPFDSNRVLRVYRDRLHATVQETLQRRESGVFGELTDVNGWST